MLRAYQQLAIDQLYDWMGNHNGNPCLVLPTGAGKSHVVAALCKDAVQNWPETRILMLTHVMELIQQNAEKMLQHWPNAPMGIYSASIGKRQLGEPITFAGIQSVRNKANLLGHVDLVIIDECFVAGTKIATPSGEVDIDKVRCGDMILNQCGFGVVEAVSCRPAPETYFLELDDGRTIECTGNHPFFTSKGWTPARQLEGGSYLFGIEDMSCMWNSVQALDKNCRERKSFVCDARGWMAQARILLGEVCQEISADRFECSGAQKNQRQAERNQAQAYSAWRERAIAAFASAGIASRIGGWMDGGIGNQDQRWTQERSVSECLQGGYCQPKNDDCYRAGRWIARQPRKARARPEKNRMSSGARVVSISRIKRKSPALVYNLQVSGHPSYFANGLAVHNCHLVSHKDEGGYRGLIDQLTQINPHLRVIGLTATPYRLGHGLITDKPAIFDGLIEPVTIPGLIEQGYLATLRSKVTTAKLSVDGVHKRGGEYIESELQAAVNTDPLNAAVVQEVIKLAGVRKSWLFFCAGIDHARNVAVMLNALGVPADVVTGDTPKKERAQIIADFKAGRLKALTNANVLTTGFDYPDIDLIAMLRPTLSPGLYVQMAGRGLRLKSHTDHCLVLDFAGVVARHGPIVAVEPPKKGGTGEGDAPIKVCDHCGEINHAAVKNCSNCGEAFPEPEPPPPKLHNDDIMGLEGSEMDVKEWVWRIHESRTSGKEMLTVTYYGKNLSDKPVTEYITILHEGYAGEKARRTLIGMAFQAGVQINPAGDLQDIVQQMNNAAPPDELIYRLDGKFYRVLGRNWSPKVTQNQLELV